MPTKLLATVVAFGVICLAGCGPSAPQVESAKAGFAKIKAGDSFEKIVKMANKTGAEIVGPVEMDGAVHLRWVLKGGGVAYADFEMKDGKVVSKNFQQKTQEELANEQLRKQGVPPEKLE